MLSLEADNSRAKSVSKDNLNDINLRPVDENYSNRIRNDEIKFDKRNKGKHKADNGTTTKKEDELYEEIEAQQNRQEDDGATQTADVNLSKYQKEKRTNQMQNEQQIDQKPTQQHEQQHEQHGEQEASEEQKYPNRNQNHDQNISKHRHHKQRQRVQKHIPDKQQTFIPQENVTNNRKRKHRSKKVTNKERRDILMDTIDERVQELIESTISLSRDIRYGRLDINEYTGHTRALAMFAHNPYVIFPTLVTLIQRVARSDDQHQSGRAESRVDSCFKKPEGVFSENATVPEDVDQPGYNAIICKLVTSLQSDYALSIQDPTNKKLYTGILAEKAIVSEAWRMTLQMMCSNLRLEHTEASEVIKSCYTYGRISHKEIMIAHQRIMDKLMDTLVNPPALDLGQFLYDKIIEDIVFDQGDNESVDHFMASLITEYRNEEHDIEVLTKDFDIMTANQIQHPPPNHRKRKYTKTQLSSEEEEDDDEEEEEEEEEVDPYEYFGEEGWFDDWW